MQGTRNIFNKNDGFCSAIVVNNNPEVNHSAADRHEKGARDMMTTALKGASRLGAVGRGALRALNVTRDTVKGITHYLNPRVLSGSGRQIAQMLGVENAAPTQAVYDMTKDALGIIARAGGFVGTHAAANVAVACFAVSSSVLGGFGRVINNTSVQGVAHSLNAAGMVIANNSNAWADVAARGFGGVVGEMTEPWDPQLGGPTDAQLQTASLQGMVDLDDQQADYAEQHKQAVESLQNRGNS